MTFKKASAPFLSVALLATALFPHAAHAFSTVTWGSAQNISGDSDVSTLGSSTPTTPETPESQPPQ